LFDTAGITIKDGAGKKRPHRAINISGRLPVTDSTELTSRKIAFKVTAFDYAIGYRQERLQNEMRSRILCELSKRGAGKIQRGNH
jgi:hypothetical protein